MNKGSIAFVAIMMVVMGAFFFVYFRDKAAQKAAPPPPTPVKHQKPVAKSAPVKAESAVETAPEPTPAEPEPAFGTITGQVLNAETGAPVPDFEIRFLPKSERISKVEVKDRPGPPKGADTEYVRVTDAEGKFTIEKALAGPGSVQVRAAGFAAASETIKGLEPGGTVADVVIKLKPAGGIDGSVRSEQGLRVADALIFVGKLPPEEQRERKAVAKTDAEGKFWYAIASTTPLTLVAWHKDFAPVSVALKPEGGPTPCEMIMGIGAAVEGTVTLGDAPFPGARIECKLQFDDFGFVAAIETDKNGKYHLEKLPAGDGRVSVLLPAESAFAARTRQWNGLLEHGKTITQDFVFAVADSVVEGTVEMDGEIPRRATLSLIVMSDTGKENRYTEMAKDGTYRFEAAPSGYASLSIDGENKDGQLGFDEYHFKLAPGAMQRKDFKLRWVKLPIEGEGEGDEAGAEPGS